MFESVPLIFGPFTTTIIHLSPSVITQVVKSDTSCHFTITLYKSGHHIYIYIHIYKYCIYCMYSMGYTSIKVTSIVGYS